MLPAPGWFENGSLSFAVAASSVGAVASIVTAVIAWTIAKAQRDIAREQKDIARTKLRLELFEKRYALYLTLWTLLTHVDGDDAEQVAGFGDDLQNAHPQAYFLFDEEVGDYFQACRARGVDLRRARWRSRLATLPVEQREQEAAAYAEHAAWFRTELSGLRGRFSKYLSLDGPANIRGDDRTGP